MTRPKLIRDKLPPRDDFDVVQLDEPTHIIALCAKLHEEAAEIADDPSDINEYGDLLNVMLSLAAKYDISFDDIIDAAQKKIDARGSFDLGHIMVKKEEK